MTRFTHLLATSLFALSGLIGCGGSLPAEEAPPVDGTVAPAVARMSVAESGETAATSSEPDTAQGTGGEANRCNLIELGPCNEGHICNVECCSGRTTKAVVSCGECQGFGHDWCGSGLRRAFWSDR